MCLRIRRYSNVFASVENIQAPSNIYLKALVQPKKAIFSVTARMKQILRSALLKMRLSFLQRLSSSSTIRLSDDIAQRREWLKMSKSGIFGADRLWQKKFSLANLSKP